MQVQDVAEILKKINRLYPTFLIPDNAKDLRALVVDWHDLLEHITFAQALKNLKEYVLNADNKYPPHPGVLAKTKSKTEIYHDFMQDLGLSELTKIEELKKTAIGPTDEQKRRVREACGNGL